MGDKIVLGWAKEEMLEHLCKMWTLCFGDCTEFCHFFFSHHQVNQSVLVLSQEDEPLSMLSILPALTRIGGRKKDLSYIYAVATHPHHRNKGYSSKLLQYANDMLIEDNVLPILVPASEGLSKFYSQRGYYPASYRKTVKIEVSQARRTFFDNGTFEKSSMRFNPIMREINAAEYKHMRDAYFEKEGYVEWSLSDIEYRIRETCYWGGFASKIICNGNEYAILAYSDNSILTIKETTIPDDILISCSTELAGKLNCSAVKILLPSYSHIAGMTEMLSMTTEEHFPTDSYMNLVLD